MTNIPYLTLSQRKALIAVEAGIVQHVYRSTKDGYRTPDGIDPRSVRKLERLGLVADTRDHISTGSINVLKVILTREGHVTLEAYR